MTDPVIPDSTLIDELDPGEPASLSPAVPVTPEADAANAATANAPLNEAAATASPTDSVGESFSSSDSMKPNGVQHYPTSGPLTSGSPDLVQLPPAPLEQMNKVLEAVPNINLVVSSQQHHWLGTLQQGIKVLPMGPVFTDRLSLEGSQFEQRVQHNGRELKGISLTHKRKPGVTELEGEPAVIELLSHLGVGGLFRAPLWASGFWVTFKPASDIEMIELNRMIASDKIALGRWSYGLPYSNSVVYMLDRVFDFALRHVYNTSVNSTQMSISELRNRVAPQDIPSFIWGFLCAQYPSGFHYEIGCINDPTKCTHVTKENLNLLWLQHTDGSVLTDWQKTHMCSLGANSMSIDSVERYRSEMVKQQDIRVVISEAPYGVAVTLKTPTINEYVEQGHRWIGGIVDGVNAVISSDADIDARNAQINRIGKAATLCQYVHWIKSIEFGDIAGSDDPTTASIKKLVDQATIEENLKFLSSIDSIREKIIEEISTYITESTVSVIGVPAFDCPVCGMPQDEKKPYPRHVNIIPLDMLQVFFVLLSQRLRRIDDR